MPRNIEAYNLADFTGGLNLNPDEFKLAANELAEALNVDVSYRGGVSKRKGYDRFGLIAADEILDGHPWYGHSAGPCVLYAGKGTAWNPMTEVYEDYWKIGELRLGGPVPEEWSDTAVTTGQWDERRSSAEHGESMFLAANHSVIQLDSGAAGVFYNVGGNYFSTAMASGDFNDDLDNPTNDKFPAASCIAFWQGSMWAADIFENTDGTARVHPTRLRWSHPNHAKDWVSHHYVDLGDDEGGAITALVPDGDRLLVFRERKIHAVVGAPPEAIQVFLVSDTLGAAGPEKVAATEQGVYFWNEERGVYRAGRSSIDWVFEKIFPALVSGRMDGRNAVLSWGGDRLYVKVKYDTVDGADQFASWFVYDPSIGKHGCWVQHAFITPEDEITGWVDMPVSLWFTPPDETPVFLAAVGETWLIRSTDNSRDLGEWSVDGSGDPIEPESNAPAASNQAKVRSAWIDIGQPGQRKRFRRADVIGNGLDENQQLHFEVFADYDAVRRRRYAEIQLDYPRDGDRYGTAVYGTSTYTEPDLRLNVVSRTGPLGRARAVQLKFQDFCDPQTLPWAIDLIVVKYTPERIRG